MPSFIWTAHATYRLTLCILGASAAMFGATAFAQPSPVPVKKPAAYPAWWFERDVIPRLNPTDNPSWDNDYPQPDDFAAVNQGQLRHIAKQAYYELEAQLPNGAGVILEDLWEDATQGTDDFAAINLGQLKYVAAPFYDRLIEENLVDAYPWAESPHAPDDYALANIGQVKYLFGFDLYALRGLLPDWWKLRYFDSTDVDPLADADHDGLTNLQEYILSLSPINPDTDGDGMSDGYEIAMGLNPALADGHLDKDGDNISNETDSRPNNTTLGILQVSIDSPTPDANY